MIRICTTLSVAGHKVWLIGRKLKKSAGLQKRPYRQMRLKCFFEKGKMFYTEYNIRLLTYLLAHKADCICAIDLDTILPVLYCTKIKRQIRVYDAHELFCEMQEIVTRPGIYKFWKAIEKKTVPEFKNGYTVNQPIAEEFRKLYGVNYIVIRNLPVKSELPLQAPEQDVIIYQGAVNEGRSFETLIPAMCTVKASLWIVGTGNFLEQAQKLVVDYQLQDKVIFKGAIPPPELKKLTRKAMLGVTLFESRGLSNYLSLANRFFDYIEAGIPQLCVDYPVYREIDDKYDIAVLTKDLSSQNLSRELNRILNDTELREHLRNNCKVAREELNWQSEEKKLIEFYNAIESQNLKPTL